jgi:serine/threonine protein kinase/tetratricopeptide (TPR) repeat protein
MEYVQGVTLDHYCGQPLDGRMKELVFDILRALGAIHARGMLHADLKPGNVIVHKTHRKRSIAKLADFGLAKAIEQCDTNHIRGTVPFLAPELIRHEVIDARADLYSFGVLLYYLLTGHLVFDGDTTSEILRQHLFLQPISPHKLNPDISPQWEEVILRLLAKEPALRYQSADEVLAALGGETTTFGASLPPIRDSFFCSQSVGREHESSVFRSCYKSLPHQGGWLALIGSVGMGKTHLLESWRIETQIDDGLWVQCSPSPDEPFSPLLTIFNALSKRFPSHLPLQQADQLLQGSVKLPYLADAPHQPESVICSQLSTHVGYSKQTQADPNTLGVSEAANSSELCVIADCGSITSSGGLDQASPAERRLQLFQKLSEILEDLPREQKIVLVIDQMERISEDTVSLLQFLVRNAPNSPCLWILAGRNGESDWSTRLCFPSDDRYHKLSLDVLSKPQIRSLLAHILGEVSEPEVLASYLAEESGGNPLLIIELLRELNEERLLRRSRGAWWFDAMILQRRQPKLNPDRLESLLQRRIQECSPLEKTLLQLTNLLGYPHSIELLQKISCTKIIQFDGSFLPALCDQVQFRDAYANLLARGLCREQWRDGVYSLRFVPSHLENTIAQQMSSANFTLWHTRIYHALTMFGLEGHSINRAALARHALHAGYLPVARALLQRAGHDFIASHAYAEGYRFFAELTRLLRQQKNSLDAGYAHEQAAKLAGYLNQHRTVKEHLQAALSLIQDNLSLEYISLQARILRRLGHEQDREGCFEQAIPCFQQAIALIDQHISSIHNTIATNNYNPSDNDAYRPNCADYMASLPRDVAAEYLLLWRSMGWSFMKLGRYPEALEAVEYALCEAEKLGDSIRLCQCHRLRAAIAFYCGNQEQLEDSAHKALNIALSASDLRGEAEAHFTFGNLANLQNRTQDAIACFEQAKSIFEKLELLEATGRCLNNLGVASYLLGNWSKAIDYWERFAAVCERLGDRTQQVNALNNFGFLYKDRGAFQQARRSIEHALQIAQEDQLERLEATLCGNLGEILWRLGDIEQARHLIELARDKATELGAKGEAIENQRRLIAIAIHNGQLEQAKTALHALEHQLKTLNLRSEQAHLLCLWGEYWLQLKSPTSAIQSLQQAASTFQELQASFEEAICQSLLAQAYLQTQQHTTAQHCAQKATQLFQTLGASWHLQQLMPTIQKLQYCIHQEVRS